MQRLALLGGFVFGCNGSLAQNFVVWDRTAGYSPIWFVGAPGVTLHAFEPADWFLGEVSHGPAVAEFAGRDFGFQGGFRVWKMGHGSFYGLDRSLKVGSRDRDSLVGISERRR